MRDDAPPAPRRAAPQSRVHPRQARPEKVAAFRVGISAESRAAAWLIAFWSRRGAQALRRSKNWSTCERMRPAT
jgi:hypothetical protein